MPALRKAGTTKQEKRIDRMPLPPGEQRVKKMGSQVGELCSP
jgi:hypothetical protein